MEPAESGLRLSGDFGAGQLRRKQSTNSLLGYDYK